MGRRVLRDYEAQRRAGVSEPGFVGDHNPHLPQDLGSDIWTGYLAPRARTSRPRAPKGRAECP